MPSADAVGHRAGEPFAHGIGGDEASFPSGRGNLNFHHHVREHMVSPEGRKQPVRAVMFSEQPRLRFLRQRQVLAGYVSVYGDGLVQLYVLGCTRQCPGAVCGLSEAEGEIGGRRAFRIELFPFPFAAANQRRHFSRRCGRPGHHHFAPALSDRPMRFILFRSGESAGDRRSAGA